MLLESAVLCMAINIYHEARGEFIPGQYGVAQVTMNRAKTPDRVCETVLEKDQFSWTKKLVGKKHGRAFLKSAGVPKDEHAWWLANRIAAYTINHRPPDITFGATHYHAKYVAPKWSSKLDRTKTMGRHIFYRLKDKSAVTEQKS